MVSDNPLDKLNARQHKFVLNLMQGMSQKDAYIQAGYDDTPDAVSNASHLADDSHVSQALTILREQSVAKLTLPLEKRMSILAEIAEHPIEQPVSAGQKLAAVAEMNKVEGSYAPQKHLVAAKVQIEVIHKKRES